MNTLSWLIYASDVIPSFGVLFILLAIALTVTGLITIIAGCQKREDASHDEDPRWKVGVGWQKFGAKMIFSAFLPIALAILIPSKTTILLIAGSQVGEKVAMSDTGQEILNDLKTAIKVQIEALKPKGK